MSISEAVPETESEARARRVVHVVGALIVLVTVAGVIWAVSGGSNWAKDRQLRAIQMGARADLELVAEAEKRYHEAHGTYTTDLKELNLWPKRVLYAFGFVNGAEIRTITKLAEVRAHDAIEKSKVDKSYKPDAPIVLSPMTKIADIDFDRLASFCPDCTATKDTFKLIAAADLDQDPVLDVWTIDQTGTIVHLIDDLK